MVRYLFHFYACQCPGATASAKRIRMTPKRVACIDFHQVLNFQKILEIEE
jgi:hypothetical protein